MSYTPKTWVSGETLTAGHMNRIEQGISTLEEELKAYVDSSDNSGGGVLLVTAVEDVGGVVEK